MVDTLEDKDVFLVKLPNKLKEFLRRDPATFNLALEDDTIGTLENEQAGSDTANNPESKSCKRPSFKGRLTLNIPVKRQKVTDIQTLHFDVVFPEVDSQRPLSDVKHFAMKLEETQDNSIQGKVRHPVIGEVQMRPCDLRDVDLVGQDLTEEERMKRLLTQDYKKQSATISEITEVVYDPAFMRILEDSGEKSIRLSLSSEKLQIEVLKLFERQSAWKIEEIAKVLDHPRNPIKEMLQKLCVFDNSKNRYELKKY